MGYIYIIRNMINGMFYLGSTINYKKRRGVHFSALKNNRHHSIYLQRAYDKYGVNSFEFIIIETCYSDPKIREQELLNTINHNDTYNVSLSASGGDLISNHPNREVLIKNSTNRLRNAIQPPRYGEMNSNWRGGKINRCEKCNSPIDYQAKRCIKCRDISGINNPFWGKRHSDETKEKISNALKGKANIACQRAVIIENVEYPSITEASKQLGIGSSLIVFRIKSKNPIFINYLYKDVN